MNQAKLSSRLPSIAEKDGLTIWIRVKSMENGLVEKICWFLNMHYQRGRNGPEWSICWGARGRSIWSKIGITLSSPNGGWAKSKKRRKSPKRFMICFKRQPRGLKGNKMAASCPHIGSIRILLLKYRNRKLSPFCCPNNRSKIVSSRKLPQRYLFLWPPNKISSHTTASWTTTPIFGSMSISTKTDTLSTPCSKLKPIFSQFRGGPASLPSEKIQMSHSTSSDDTILFIFHHPSSIIHHSSRDFERYFTFVASRFISCLVFPSNFVLTPSSHSFNF